MEMEIIVSVILLFVGIAGLVIIHACIVGRAFRNANNDNGIRGNPYMSQEEIKKLPSFGYRAEGKGKKSCGECAVCLENFNEGDLCRLLPNCNHSFHTQCIDLWLKKTAVCPICRGTVNSTKEVEQSKCSSDVGVEVL